MLNETSLWLVKDASCFILLTRYYKLPLPTQVTILIPPVVILQTYSYLIRIVQQFNTVYSHYSDKSCRRYILVINYYFIIRSEIRQFQVIC